MSHPVNRDYLRAAGGSVGTDDAELLGRFAAERDGSAFELLVWRHAALVQRVCQSVLRDHAADRTPILVGVNPSVIHLAEGALQAMTVSIGKLTAATAALLCALTAGVWGFAEPQAPPPAKPQPALALKPAPGAPVADAKMWNRSQNNLKQILLAIHSFHDVTGQIPGDITDKDGRPILSWRVAILPFIEQQNLYKEFKLDEPWDSEHNKKLLIKMPEIYRTGIDAKDATRTYYQGFSGPGTVFEPGKKITLPGISDGTSNTIAVVETGPPVEWTRPADIPYHPMKPLVQMDGPFANALFVGIGDGSVFALKREIDETTLRRLIERDDGQVFSLDGAIAKLPLTKGQLKDALELLGRNEKLITGIAEQLREQQRLLAEVAKKQNANDPIKGIDLERLSRLQADLEEQLGILKKQTDELRQQAQRKK